MFYKKLLKIISISFIFSAPVFASPHFQIEHWQTKNGAQVFYVYRPQLPILDVQIAFAAGSSRDGNKNSGLASLTTQMLNDGAGTLTEDQLASQLDALGANYSVQTDQDMSVLQLRTLTDANILNPAIHLFSMMASQPTFPETAFLREQKQAIATVQSREQDPQYLGSELFMRTLYGASPYADPVYGTINTLQTLTLSQVKDFYHQYFVSQNATIAIVGNVTETQAKAIAEELTIKLATGNKAANLSAPQVNPATAVSFKFPAQQTTVYLGELGVERGNKNYFPLLLANFCLGGDMTSRLFNIVREQHGYTYNISSIFVPLQVPGPFYIFFQSQQKNVNQAIQLTKTILQNYIATGPTQNELDAAKQDLIGSFPLRIANNADITQYLLVIGFYHLPLNYLDTFQEKMSKVSLSDVQKALKEQLSMNKLIQVTLGPK